MAEFAAGAYHGEWGVDACPIVGPCRPIRPGGPSILCSSYTGRALKLMWKVHL